MFIMITVVIFAVSNAGAIMKTSTAILSLLLLVAITGCNLGGVITDDQKKPLEGVTVQLTGADRSATVTTKGDGSFVFKNLKAGAYTVTPVLNGYTFDPAERTITMEQGEQAVTACRFTAIQDNPASQLVEVIETGHDQVGIPGKPVTLAVKVELLYDGDFSQVIDQIDPDWNQYLSPDLKGHRVRFSIDGSPIGIAVTDRDGVARIDHTPESVGIYTITYELAEPDDSGTYLEDDGQARLFVLTDRPTLVVDIDGTLSDYPDWKVPFSGQKADAFKGAVETLQQLTETYHIVYLTARDDALDNKTRQFLFKDHDPETEGTQCFPNGPVLYNDWGLNFYEEFSQLDPERHAAFKTETIKQMQMVGVPLVAGIGNAETDRIAYEGTGLEAFIIDHDMEAQHPGTFYSQVLKTLTEPSTVAAFMQKVAAVVENRNLTDPADIFQRDMDILTGTSTTIGNQVETLINRDNALEAFISAIQSADSSITYYTFEFHDDEAGNLIADQLILKSLEGIQVQVSLDAIGSHHVPPLMANPLVEKMTAGGVLVHVYNLPSASTAANILHRDHRKAIIIDQGQLAMIGGMNTGTDYLGTGNGEEILYHDIFIRVIGPAAHKIESIFSEQWHKSIRSTAGSPAADHDAGGGLNVRIVNHNPKEDFHIRDAYVRMIAEAKSHIYLENSFPMDAVLRDAMIEAAGRGVRVDYIYGIGSEAIGEALVKATIENKLKPLLEAGVRVHKYPKYVHSKSLSVDGQYASIGSSNIDNYSLEINHEVIAVISDAAWVSAYETSFFVEDIKLCEPITLELLESDPTKAFWRELIDQLWPDPLE